MLVGGTPCVKLTLDLCLIVTDAGALERGTELVHQLRGVQTGIEGVDELLADSGQCTDQISHAGDIERKAERRCRLRERCLRMLPEA